MTTLITKQVKIPNDRYTNATFDDIHQMECVKSICEFFENDLGLVQSNDTGQLDHNNITSIDVQDIYDKSITWKWDPPFSYGYKVYVIEDNKNMDPLYLKVEFGLQDMSRINNISFRSYTSMIIGITLFGSTDGAGKHGGKGVHIGHWYSNARTYSYDVDIGYDSVNLQSESYGFYDKENGRLFIALFPNSRYSIYGHLYQATLRCGFYIEKVLDDSIPEYTTSTVIYRICSFIRSADETFDARQYGTQYIHQKTGIKVDNIEFDYKGPVYSYIYPGATTIGQTMYHNPLTGYSRKNENILFCDNKLVRPYTVVKVTDKDGIQHDYFALTCQSTGVYAQNINNAWLFKI